MCRPVFRRAPHVFAYVQAQGLYRACIPYISPIPVYALYTAIYTLCTALYIACIYGNTAHIPVQGLYTAEIGLFAYIQP